MMRFGQICWQPGQQQIKNVVVRTVSKREAENFFSRDQIPQRSALRRALRIFRLRPAFADMFALGRGKFFVPAWISIERQKQREINNADDSGDRKICTPAEMHEHHTEHRNSDGGRKLRHRIERRRGETAFVFWKPVAGGFGRSRKSWSLANSEQDARAEKTFHSERKCGSERRRSPNDCADNSDAPHAETIEQQTGRKLQRRIRPVVSAGEKSKKHGGHSKCVVQRFFGNRKIYAVKITYKNSETQQSGDAPPPPRHCVFQRRFGGSQEADRLNQVAHNILRMNARGPTSAGREMDFDF